jgi:hypothetical protein
MLTYEDCLQYSGLDETEVEAISEHEHIPEIVAAEMGSQLLATPDGETRIRGFISDDIKIAEAHGCLARAQYYRAALRRFDSTHPHH